MLPSEWVAMRSGKRRLLQQLRNTGAKSAGKPLRMQRDKETCFANSECKYTVDGQYVSSPEEHEQCHERGGAEC